MPNNYNFRFKISFKNDPGKLVPLSVIAERFLKIQNIVNILGDQFEGNTFRSRGDFPNSVKEHCELALSKINIGSADCYITTASTQRSLLPEKSIGERAIKTFSEAISIINCPDGHQQVIDAIIPDEKRRRKFLQELESLWPDNESPYQNEVSYGDEVLVVLNPEKKKDLVKLFEVSHQDEKIQEICGRITGLYVDKKRKFTVETADGQVNGRYSADMEEELNKKLGSFVHFNAIMKLHKGTFECEIDDSVLLKEVSEYPLSHAIVNNHKVELIKPLILKISYLDEQYHLENDEFLLDVYSSQLKTAIEDIKEQFDFLYSEYVHCDINELTQDAIKLREKIINYYSG